ncbi:hypothetical protein BHM03_00026455 [Ensete ventricosum]|nr:hypothetical protein BHM03_00026455 [Ensete ventricosum]
MSIVPTGKGNAYGHNTHRDDAHGGAACRHHAHPQGLPPKCNGSRPRTWAATVDALGCRLRRGDSGGQLEGGRKG